MLGDIMSPELILNLIAGIVLLAAAISLKRQRDLINSIVVTGGVVLMAAGIVILTYAPIHPSLDGQWPMWFRVSGAFGPAGLVLLAIAVFRLSTSTKRCSGSN
jgi:hypothetical protein